MRKRAFVVLAILMLLAVAVQPVSAAEPSPSEKSGWEVIVAPYIWATSIEGEVRAGRAEADVDVSFSDILEQLDFGYMGWLEVRKDRWGFVVNPVIALLSDDADRGPLDVDVELTQVILDFGVMYRVLSQPVSSLLGKSEEDSKEDPRRLDIDLFGGGRYWYLKSEIDIAGPIVNIEEEKSTDWVDPFIGTRVRADLTDRFLVTVMGNVGGFGIGEASEFTWDAWGLVGYRLSERWTLHFGYRALGFDREEGDVEADLTYHGPIIGVSRRF